MVVYGELPYVNITTELFVFGSDRSRKYLSINVMEVANTQTIYLCSYLIYDTNSVGYLLMSCSI